MSDVMFFALSAISFGMGAFHAYRASKRDVACVNLGFCLLMIGVALG